VVALGLGNSILPNFVEQRFVADLQKRRCLLAIPVGLLERLPDGFAFGFVFGGARQRFQSAACFSTLGSGVSPRAAAVAVIARLQLGDSKVLSSRKLPGHGCAWQASSS